MRDKFTHISEETLHAAPGWSHKLVDNQVLLLRTIEALEKRIQKLEKQVTELSEWRGSQLPLSR